MASNRKTLKAYVRYDGTGRVIAGGPILSRFKPKVGNWVEVDAYECCNYNANPILLYDFSEAANYTGTISSVSDLSGNNNNGIPVQGTGNGTPENIPNAGVTYSSINKSLTYAGYTHSVRLPNQFKFGNQDPYTINIWFKPTLSGDAYQGLVASEGRSSGSPIGTTCFFQTVGPNPAILFYRWNGHTASPNILSATFGVNGMPAFVAGAWYMASFGYDGTSMFLRVYDHQGIIFKSSIPSSAVIETSPSWGAFLGLRYNGWFKGEFGYVSIYDKWIGTSEVNTIYKNIKIKNGY